MQEILAEQQHGVSCYNRVLEMGEKLYGTTAVEGREVVRIQMQELQAAIESFYDSVSSSERQLQAKRSRSNTLSSILFYVGELKTDSIVYHQLDDVIILLIYQFLDTLLLILILIHYVNTWLLYDRLVLFIVIGQDINSSKFVKKDLGILS